MRIRHARRARTVKVQAFVDGRRKLTRRGRSIKTVTLHGLPLRTFRLRIVATQSNGHKLVIKRTYRGCRTQRR